MTRAELAAAAESRSRFYWWLAGWLLNVSAQADLQSLREMNGVTDQVSPELADALNGFIAAAQAVPDLERETRLGAEYTRLFGGLSQDVAPPPPFESVWREDRLVGEATLEVLDAYQQAGFADIDATPGPQDHLAVELKFMSLLALREQEAWLAGNETSVDTRLIQQRDFLDQHALTWIPQWAARIRKNSHEPFYRYLADLISAYLAMDRQHLQDLLTNET